MQRRQAAEKLFTSRREFDQDFPAVLETRPADNCAAFCQSINQFDSAVMAQHEALRERTYRRARIPRQSFDRQQQLMLLRFQAVLSCGLFREVQKLAYAVAEFS